MMWGNMQEKKTMKTSLNSLLETFIKIFSFVIITIIAIHRLIIQSLKNVKIFLYRISMNIHSQFSYFLHALKKFQWEFYCLIMFQLVGPHVRLCDSNLILVECLFYSLWMLPLGVTYLLLIMIMDIGRLTDQY